MDKTSPVLPMPEYDRLLDAASNQTDKEERLRLLQAAERRFLDSAAIIPLYFYVTKHLISPQLKGFQPSIPGS